jgi:RNA polymerase sigma factor (sigma-70 family)
LKLKKDVDQIIEETVNMTVLKLKSAGLMKEDRKTAVQKTEELLRNYPKFKLSDQEHTKELCRKIETALDTIRSDYYFEVISLYYFERYTREEVAVHFNTSETTISRNKSRLLSELAAVLFSDDFIYEIFL